MLVSPQTGDSSSVLIQFVPAVRCSLATATDPLRRNESETSTGSQARSKAIPIHGLKRTLSEEQLQEDERMADFRDYVVFQRIVKGMSRQQQETVGYFARLNNDRCLANIIGVHNLSSEELNDMCQNWNETDRVLHPNLSFLLQESYQELQEDPIFEMDL